jgi:hypothetical protein
LPLGDATQYATKRALRFANQREAQSRQIAEGTIKYALREIEVFESG